jgi:hypothetical protein
MRGWFACWAFLIAAVAACSTEPSPSAPPPAAAPAPPSSPASPPGAAAGGADAASASKPAKMVANPDGLSLAERIAKRQADETKLAAQLAVDEHKRLLAYDKGKLPLHKEVFAAIKKLRAAFDKAKTKDDVEKIRGSQQKMLEATGKKMATIDPKGGNSNVTTDYDVMLNALATDFPDALEASFAGDRQGLADQNAELDRRSKKIEAWLAELKSAKK